MIKWYDFNDDIAIRVEKSEDTHNNLMITVHSDLGEADYHARLDVREDNTCSYYDNGVYKIREKENELG